MSEVKNIIIICSLLVGLCLIYLLFVISVIAGLSSLVIYFFVCIWYFGRLHDEREKRRTKQKEAKRKEEALKQENWRNEICPVMVQKLQSTGFSSLNQAEKKYLFKLSDQMGENLENLHENEVKVLEVAFSNQGVYNMLQMRSNQLQPNNKAALKHLKTIKYATMLSGLNAAREIGEDIGESFSE